MPQESHGTLPGGSSYFEYNGVRARLLNSQARLEGTNLALFNIETTLIRWYKDSVRRDEIKLLMQGLSPPQPELCATDRLSPAQSLPSSSGQPPSTPHTFPESEDTTGQAKVRGVGSTSVLDSCTTATDPTPTGPPQSRTTAWRHKKGKQKEEGSHRKICSCRICHMPMSTEGHTQFRGQRYCPNAPGQIPKEEWLAERRAEAKSKAHAAGASGGGR